MVNYDPLKRPLLASIFSHPWLKEITELTNQNRVQLEREYVNECTRREKIIRECKEM